MTALPDSGAHHNPAFVLAINAGSSSIRFALYDAGKTSARRLRGKIERIGLSDTTLTVDDLTGAPEPVHHRPAPHSLECREEARLVERAELVYMYAAEQTLRAPKWNYFPGSSNPWKVRPAWAPDTEVGVTSSVQQHLNRRAA